MATPHRFDAAGATWVAFEAWAAETLHPRRLPAILRALKDFFGGSTFGGLGGGYGDRAEALTHGDVTQRVAGHRENLALAERKYGASRTPEVALRHWVVFCAARRAATARATLTREERSARPDVTGEELDFFNEDGDFDAPAAAPPARGAPSPEPEAVELEESLFAQVAYVVEEAIAETLSAKPLPSGSLAPLASRGGLRRHLDAERLDRRLARSRSKLLETYVHRDASSLGDLLGGATLKEFLASRAHRFKLLGVDGQKNRPLKLTTVRYAGRPGVPQGCEVGARFLEGALAEFVAAERATTCGAVDAFARALLAPGAAPAKREGGARAALFRTWLRDEFDTTRVTVVDLLGVPSAEALRAKPSRFSVDADDLTAGAAVRPACAPALDAPAPVVDDDDVEARPEWEATLSPFEKAMYVAEEAMAETLAATDAGAMNVGDLVGAFATRAALERAPLAWCQSLGEEMAWRGAASFEDVASGAGKESEIPNFKASYLGRFPLVSADLWTSDHLSERSRSVDAFPGTRARGTLMLKRT